MSFIDKLPKWFNRQSDEELGITINTVDREFNITFEDIKNMRSEFDMNTATTIWLDEHGSWYGVPRNPDESDPSYRDRIWKEIIKGKLTVPNIIDAVGKILLNEDDTVTVKEMYKYIFKYNISDLSGDHMIQDGIYVSNNIIDVQVHGPVPPDIYDLLEELRSAGVKVYVTSVQDFGGKVLPMKSDIGVKAGIDYQQFIELYVKKIHEGGFIVGDSSLSEGDMLSGGAFSYSALTVFIELISKWKRMENSPTFINDPINYNIPEDTTNYFNMTRTDICYEGLVLGITAPKIISFDSKYYDGMTLASPYIVPGSRIPEWQVPPDTPRFEDVDLVVTIQETKVVVDKVSTLGVVLSGLPLLSGSMVPMSNYLGKTINELSPVIYLDRKVLPS